MFLLTQAVMLARNGYVTGQTVNVNGGGEKPV
jgi:hypothetical protein